MIPALPGLPREGLPALVLVADEDARVVELLSFALKANHFRVQTAQDGDEALRLAQTEHPDLVVADVRLPRRGGLELCDLLRRDPEHGGVPILLLSSANDTDSRIEALAHGADDFMSKPFSPKELIARAQRLLSRARDTARHAKRSAELERDLGRVQAEAARARESAEREQTLRSLASDMLGELLRTLDLDELDGRLLRTICRRTGAKSAVLLAANGAGGLVPVAVRGELFERWAGLELCAAGACVEWLTAAGRALRRDELERLPEPPREAALLAAHGGSLLAAVRGAGGPLGAVVVCEDRADGTPFTAFDRECLGALCAAAAPARATAERFRLQQDRSLALLGAPACGDPKRRAAAREAHERLLGAARAFGVEPADRALLELALDLGPWAWTKAGRSALEGVAESDPTGRVPRLCRLLSDAEECAQGEFAGADLCIVLAAAGLRFQALRLSGRSSYEAWRSAVAWIGLTSDPRFRDRFPEVLEPARRPARAERYLPAEPGFSPPKSTFGTAFDVSGTG